MNAFGISALSLLTALDAKRNVARGRPCEQTGAESDDPMACESGRTPGWRGASWSVANDVRCCPNPACPLV